MKLQISMFSFGFFTYLLLMATGVLFQFAIITLITAVSFIAVKNESLILLYRKMADFARYPLTVMSITGIALVVLPVIIFFVVALYAWHRAIRKYTSAGG